GTENPTTSPRVTATNHRHHNRLRPGGPAALFTAVSSGAEGSAAEPRRRVTATASSTGMGGVSPPTVAVIADSAVRTRSRSCSTVAHPQRRSPHSVTPTAAPPSRLRHHVRDRLLISV